MKINLKKEPEELFLELFANLTNPENTNTKQERLDKTRLFAWKLVEALEVRGAPNEARLLAEEAHHIPDCLDSSTWADWVSDAQVFLRYYYIFEACRIIERRPPKKSKSKSPRGPYRGTLERQKQIVDFVLNKKIAKGNKSIKWQRMSDDWNLAHPDDDEKMTKVQLEYAFNDAVRDEHVQREYFDQFVLLISQVSQKQIPLNKGNAYKALLAAYDQLADSKKGENTFYKQILNKTKIFKVFPSVEASDREVEEEIRRIQNNSDKKVEEVKR